jgi:predicted nuclease with TOPRIM domain
MNYPFYRLKTKLENRRLDYDAKMNKVQKLKKESQLLEEETRVAQSKYDETLGDLGDKMVEIESNEESQIREVGSDFLRCANSRIFTLLFPISSSCHL